MKKKFKTRVSFFAQDKYTVDYCSYWLIPFWWKSLMYWVEMGYTSDLECMNEDLYDVKEAERMAKILTLKKVNMLIAIQTNNMASFYRRKNEFLKENVPYRSNTF